MYITRFHFHGVKHHVRVKLEAMIPAKGRIYRSFSTIRPLRSSWSPSPAPPRLPKGEQEVFEQLQRHSTGAFSTPRSPPQVNQSPDSSLTSSSTQQNAVVSGLKASSKQEDTLQQPIRAKVQLGEELHPNVRRGAPPEFEGDKNPKTGEVGGPKNDPLKWGGSVDWSYNGRVSDF